MKQPLYKNPVLYIIIPLLFFTSPWFDLIGQDFLTATSELTTIDKAKHTIQLDKNVYIVRKSSGSSLNTDRLILMKDATSDQFLTGEAIGNVEINFYNIPKNSGESQKSVEKGHLNCDYAHFDRSLTSVLLNGNLRVKTNNYFIQADKIRYNYGSEKGKITAKPEQQVKVIIKKKSKPNAGNSNQKQENEIVGLADQVLIDKPAGKLVLQGNVFLNDQQENSKFKSNRADLFFDEQDEIEKIIANGKFSLSQPGRISTANRATFNYHTEIIDLIGDAVVKENNQVEFTAPKIKMYLKVKKGVIQGVDQVPVKMKIELD